MPGSDGDMRFLVICPNGSDSELLTSLLREAGKSTVDAVNHLQDKTVLERLERIESPLLFLRADGEHLQLGKWRRGEQICPVCLDLRAIALRELEESVTFFRKGRAAPLSGQWLSPFAFAIISELIISLESGHKISGFGFDLHLPSLYVTIFRSEQHSRCPLCCPRTSDSNAQAIIRLSSSPKTEIENYRAKRASEIAIPLDTCLNRICGMFGPDSTQSRHSNFVAQVSGGFREPAAPWTHHRWSGRKTTYRSSLTVGLLEAFERYAGLRMRSKRCTVFDTYHNLKDRAIDPRDCGLYEKSVYEKNPRLTPFSEDVALRWVWGYSLTENRPVLAPLQFVYYGDRDSREPRIIDDNSNGCAIGTSLEEAVFHGLLELIERDSFMIHWNMRLTPGHIILNTVRDQELKCTIDRFHRLNLEVFLLDSRLDLRVPSIIAVVVRRDDGLGALALATGSGFNPETAMKAALAEIASRQTGFEARTHSMDEKLRSALSDFTAIRTMSDHGNFYGLPEAAQHAQFLVESEIKVSVEDAYTDWQSAKPKTFDLTDDIQHCIIAVTSAGMNQIVVVDQSTPEQLRIGLRTVRVLVPGMMPLDFGYGRSRAISLSRQYAVPVKLGLKNGPLGPDQMNWVPHPFV
jgi:ribosomal protein S12 methylthiotransferase accessory factor